MLITHDRLLLYYSILLGIDVGYTVHRIVNNIKTYYLITFINEDDTSKNINKYLKRSTYQTGGKDIKRNKTIKLKCKYNVNIKYNNNKMAETLQFKYNKLILDDIIQYKKNIENILWYSQSIESKYYRYIQTSKQDDVIKYIRFMNNTQYTNEHISKLVYTYYIDIASNFDDYKHVIRITKNNESNYYSIISDLEMFEDIYNIRDYDKHMKDISI